MPIWVSGTGALTWASKNCGSCGPSFTSRCSSVITTVRMLLSPLRVRSSCCCICWRLSSVASMKVAEFRSTVARWLSMGTAERASELPLGKAETTAFSRYGAGPLSSASTMAAARPVRFGNQRMSGTA